jgi:hypothetical protein
MKPPDTPKKRAGRPALPDAEKRTARLELRLTIAEKQHLKRLSEHANVPLATLLLEATLGTLANLPQFGQLPADLMPPILTLQQTASQLFSFAHRLHDDPQTQQQIRELVFTLGTLTQQLTDTLLEGSTQPER